MMKEEARYTDQHGVPSNYGGVWMFSVREAGMYSKESRIRHEKMEPGLLQ